MSQECQLAESMLQLYSLSMSLCSVDTPLLIFWCMDFAQEEWMGMGLAVAAGRLAALSAHVLML